MISIYEKNAFPLEEQHKKAWESLAKNIANTKDRIQTSQSSSSTTPGELIIIGSGIQSLDFIRGDEALIKLADAVFYCVADPGTVTWIKTVRPDAYDLYVLYGNHKVRYTTYMQMTEAMLYYVRQGKKVVSIYYGHPGIFALSPHRAILIARREGHKAMMKPGISALDCLCADLGVDPAHPGLQTHEATDVLIRKRVLDTTLHIVLWQVGLIGDQGFRDQGYINQYFPIFIEYLQTYYGEDYPVTHYIASRYPTIPPLIESYRLSELYDPKLQLKINGISTFYLTPQKVIQTDSNMLQRLGMLKPGQSVKFQNNTLREIGAYGPREMLAFEDFRRFKVPITYRWQSDLAPSRFIINLHDDPLMQSRYSINPVSTVAAFPGLTLTERRLLASRNSNNIQCAARGLLERSLYNEAFLRAFFSNQSLVNRFIKVIKQSSQQTLKQTLNEWVRTIGYSPNWLTLYKSLSRMSRERIYLWTGIYYSESQNYLITIQGGVNREQNALIYINGHAIKHYQFSHGVLQWPMHRSIEQGLLRLDVDNKGRRRLVGIVGPYSDSPRQAFFAPEISLNIASQNPAWMLAQASLDHPSNSYKIRIQGSSAKHKLIVKQNSVSIDGKDYPISVCSNHVTWRGKNGDYPVGNLIFFLDPITLTPSLLGSLQNTLGKTLSCQGYSMLINEAAYNQAALFGLSHTTWSTLVNQCKHDHGHGSFLWFTARKMQSVTKTIYTILNQVIL